MAIPIDWLKVARLMLHSRKLEECEVNELAPQGLVRYQFCAAGHDLAQILLAQHLDHAHDAATVYYRSRPFALASGLTLDEALRGGMAKLGGTSEGRECGVMFNLPSRTGAAILPSSGNVGTQYPVAAGWAQAISYHTRVLRDETWRGAMAIALGGDGSIAANGFWSSLNIVTVERLPMLYFIEHNDYGISVPAAIQTPGGSIARNLSSFGNLRVLSGLGFEPEETSRLIGEAVQHVREGHGPCLLQLSVPRLFGHTFTDTQAYKHPERKEIERQNDPLGKIRQMMLERGTLTPENWTAMENEAEEAIRTQLETARTAPEPDVASIRTHVFFDGKVPVLGGLRSQGIEAPVGNDFPTSIGPRINFIDAVRRTMESEMTLNPRILLFGEDVGIKGGVHGATRDMQSKFGAQRVFDTSLSEDGIIGRATGLALAGLMPVPEIQFRKYADPAYEQLNDLATLRWRTAGRMAAPVVVRIPVGYGKRNSDPWHSVCAESVFAHMIGWRVAFPSNAEDAAGLLRTALRGDDPTIFLEHRALLDSSAGRAPYPGDGYMVPFGRAKILTHGSRLTLITWGDMVHAALQAAQAFPDEVEVIDLRTIIPWDRDSILASVKKTSRALILHEDTITAGFGAEIAATLADEALAFLDAPVKRLAVPDVPIPYHRATMFRLLPNVEEIQCTIRTLMNY